jgi:hypothetical protein
MAKYLELPGRQVRYWLYRFRTNAEGGAPATGAPRGLKPHFEKLPGFRGWKEFANTWDVDKDKPFDIYSRQFTELQEWEATLEKVLRDLPDNGS